jgi:fused signal recognition particle receptor
VFSRGLDEQAWEELEESLIAADVGVEATLELVAGLRDRVKAEGITDGDAALALLKEVLRFELGMADRSLARREGGPTVWLFTGVNGTGKTTSIGKLAKRHVDAGEKVVLAAADTFRAAASEQLEIWGERSGARVIRQDEGADPAAVAFDGWKAASAAGADLLMIDTAGRLQNKKGLMEELSKVKRVVERESEHIDEVLLVLDATTGQNGLSQAQAFMEAVDVTGVVLTKLDGTAKGGIVIAIQRALDIPVKLVGLGEGIDDLAEFDPDAFIDALFADVLQEVELDELIASADLLDAADMLAEEDEG